MLAEYIGRVLRAERHKRNWTVDQLLDHWPGDDKPSNNSVGRWERGFLTSFDGLVQLAAIYRRKVSEIVAEAEALKADLAGVDDPAAA